MLAWGLAFPRSPFPSVAVGLEVISLLHDHIINLKVLPKIPGWFMQWIPLEPEVVAEVFGFLPSFFLASPDLTTAE